MRYLLFSLLLPFFGVMPAESPAVKKIVSCSPEELKKVFAVDVFSVKDGNWFDPNVWSNGKVPAATDNVSVGHNLYTNNQSVQVGSTTAAGGKLTMRTGGIQFRGINNNLFQGSGMSFAETPNDTGLWVQGSGELDLQGEAKRAWTTLMGSAVRGSLSITVNDAFGWKIGDEIGIVPTDTPNQSQLDWNDAKGKLGEIDPFALKFERRRITAIAGNTVSFNSPLTYDHLAVTSQAMGKTWTAEVANLTRSIVIEGTNGLLARAHIFIKSSRVQTVKYVEGRYLGARKDGYRSGDLVNGRYGIHFHHCGDGSIGSIVEGNAFHDLGNRMYVPHESNGITFKSNVAWDGLEAMFWWDFQDQSHDIIYDGNLAALRRLNGSFGGSVGFELGQGDGNKCINNVAVYLHHGSDAHQQGAFAWNTNNVGVWVFNNNLSHSNVTGLFVWQNVPDNHVNENYWSYNNVQGIHHGAYINSYMYRGGGHYNSLVKVEAIQGNTVPLFQNVAFDGAGKLDHVLEFITSPNRGTNVVLSPTFTGYKNVAVLMNTALFTGEPVAGKVVDIVNPKGDLRNLAAFSPISIYGSYFRIQLTGGVSTQLSQSGRGSIPAFEPVADYGTGTGLLGKYFNGANFERPAFTRLDPMIKFQQWSVDFEQSPDGVHHTIATSGPYSVVWEGFYVPTFSGQHQFAFESFGGVRLTIDGQRIYDRWSENNDRIMFDAPLVVLEKGKKHRIKLEHFNTNGERGLQLFTKQGGRYLNVPPGQLYPDDSGTEPLPVNRPPVVSAGNDRTIQDSIIKIEGSAADPDNNLALVKWTGPGGITLTQNLSDAAHVMAKGKPGVYPLRITATDKAGLSVSDEMVLTLQPKVDTTATDPCKIFVEADYLELYPDVRAAVRPGGFKSGLDHYNQFGKSENRKINKLCRVIKPPTIVKIVTYYSDGTTKIEIP